MQTTTPLSVNTLVHFLEKTDIRVSFSRLYNPRHRPIKTPQLCVLTLPSGTQYKGRAQTKFDAFIAALTNALLDAPYHATTYTDA